MIRRTQRHMPGSVVAMLAAACVLLAAFDGPVSAANGDMPFSVNLAERHYCLINLLQPGAFTSNVGLTELSSKNPGGAPGKVDVQTTNGSFDLSIDAPLSFSSEPAGGGVNTNFSATMTGVAFSGSGSGTFGETSAATSLKKGVTTVDVHFIATRTAGTFPSGSYASVVTLRCE
ncbi:MAG: hypothetical protein R3D45_16670 [Rhizobiaceae bacterium]